MKEGRRRLLRTLSGGIALLATGTEGVFSQVPQSGSLGQAKKDMARAWEEHARQVERLYSTKPIKVRLGTREFVIAANYFSEVGRDHPDRIVVKDSFSLVLFLPEFGGFTKENWKQGWFDKRRIDVPEVSLEPKKPPHQIFDGLRPSLETIPTLRVAGLEGRRWKNPQNKGVYWTGIRSKEGFFLLHSSHAPNEQMLPDTYPLCDAQYYSEREKLFIAYRYSLDHISRWEEIDNSIWTKLRAWQAT